MSAATCCDCGSSFYREPDEHWKRRCYTCWKASKAQPECTDENMHFYRIGYEAGRRAVEAFAAPEPPPIDKTRLRELIQLAHPDKHGNSELAQRVTQWLLDLRKRVTA